MTTSITDLSDALAAILETTSPAVVRVEAGANIVSGLVLDATTIVTVRHGLPDDAPVSVTTHDGTVLSATILGHDARLDLGFLTVADVALTPLSTPDADTPKTGHLVLTVGRGARGLRSSLGIVGAVGPAWRTRGGADVHLDIDVDATLHPTSAGGPLLDASGRLVGINTPGLRPGGTTVPIATVHAALAHVREHGSVRPGLLGVRVRTTPLPPDLAAEHGQHQGLLVLGTPRRSPAARAGVESGDVLLTVNGAIVRSLLDLRTAVSTSGGSEVPVRILRAGQVVDLQVPVMAVDGLRHGWGRKGGRRRGPGGRGGPWRRFRKAARMHHHKRC